MSLGWLGRMNDSRIDSAGVVGRNEVASELVGLPGRCELERSGVRGNDGRRGSIGGRLEGRRS
jgi:hypothetical protein